LMRAESDWGDRAEKFFPQYTRKAVLNAKKRGRGWTVSVWLRWSRVDNISYG